MSYAPIKIIVDKLLITATTQEVFDFVASHLLRQGARSERAPDHDGFVDGCAYRGVDGLTCAIGKCISDAMYRPHFEGEAFGPDTDFVRNLLDLPPLGTTVGDKLSVEDRKRLSFVRSLQIHHDDYDPEHWPTSLKTFADKHGLEFDLDRLMKAELVEYAA